MTPQPPVTLERVINLAAVRTDPEIREAIRIAVANGGHL